MEFTAAETDQAVLREMTVEQVTEFCGKILVRRPKLCLLICTRKKGHNGECSYYTKDTGT